MAHTSIPKIMMHAFRRLTDRWVKMTSAFSSPMSNGFCDFMPFWMWRAYCSSSKWWKMMRMVEWPCTNIPILSSWLKYQYSFNLSFIQTTLINYYFLLFLPLTTSLFHKHLVKWINYVPLLFFEFPSFEQEIPRNASHK